MRNNKRKCIKELFDVFCDYQKIKSDLKREN